MALVSYPGAFEQKLWDFGQLSSYFASKVKISELSETWAI